jgi:hypothetical protein
LEGEIILPELYLHRVPPLLWESLFQRKPDHFYRKYLALSVDIQAGGEDQEETGEAGRVGIVMMLSFRVTI